MPWILKTELSLTMYIIWVQLIYNGKGEVLKELSQSQNKCC